MLYALVHPIAKLGFRIFYRHIHVHGIENIPDSGPVLIAANHPTAFIEPCLAACSQKRTLNFIVRGDIFKNPFYIRLLKSLHLIPIFRFKDGYANLKNNQETFRYCNEVLKERKAIFILAEGRTIQEKKLRPIQKGAARMAFGAFDAYGINDTMIVPMGFTYELANSWRKDVMISCGKPIYLKDYLAEYNENPNLAIQAITDELANRLRERIVNIDNKHDEIVCDQLFEISKNNSKIPIFPILIKGNQQLKTEQNIANKFMLLEDAKKQKITTLVNNYSSLLKQTNTQDCSVLNSNKNFFLKFILYSVLLLISLPGVLFNILPVLIARTIASKKVYVKEFQAPVLFALVTFLSLVWHLFIMLLGGIVFGLKIIYPLVIFGIMGFLSVISYEQINKIFAQMRFRNCKAEQKEILISSRKKIVEYINNETDEFN